MAVGELTMAWAVARRELRSGLQGFWIFLACLMLGTGAIAIVGSLSAAVERSMYEQGQPLLGGDIEFAVVHRTLETDEMRYVTGLGPSSTVASLRAMAAAGEQQSLVEVKAVDEAYPLFGTVELDGAGALPDALRRSPSGTWRAVAEPGLLTRLGIEPGDRLRLGDLELEIAGTIAAEPDRVSDGFILAPRLMIPAAALTETGLIKPGSLVTWRTRIKLPPGTGQGQIAAIADRAGKAFPDAGWRIRTRDRASPGVDRFLERLTFFMTLVGLTALIVGGVGVANAVNAFAERRRRNIAMLKCLGGSGRFVFAACLMEILAIATVAIVAALVLGAVVPLIGTSVLAALLPFPVSVGFEPGPLIRAAVFGYLVTLAFSIWPLSHAAAVAPSALFRDERAAGWRWPGPRCAIAIAIALAGIAALVLTGFDNRKFALWYMAGITGSFALLAGLAWLVMRGASAAPKVRSAVARFAIANLHRTGAPTPSSIISLGLGLALFVALSLIDGNISRELRAGIPDKAPAFFFLDVQKDELAPFSALIGSQSGVSRVGSAPMLRGRVKTARGVPVDKLNPDPDIAWAFRGDRGLTYAAELPEGSVLTEGEWWPADYTGPPLVSFVDEVARGAGLKIGDEVTVNVLGRDVTARIANLRRVDWRSLQINFVMVFSPNTLAAAPHVNIVTVAMDPAGEQSLLGAAARAFPTITPIRVRDALDAVNTLVANLLAAVRSANAITLITGILVLAGSLSAGLSARTRDAVILKTCGVTRRQLMTAFMLEYALLGTVTAVFAVLAGSLAAWAVLRFLIDMPWTYEPATAVVTALAAVVLTIVAGLASTWKALAARPARVLRTE